MSLSLKGPREKHLGASIVRVSAGLVGSLMSITLGGGLPSMKSNPSSFKKNAWLKNEWMGGVLFP